MDRGYVVMKNALSWLRTPMAAAVVLLLAKLYLTRTVVFGNADADRMLLAGLPSVLGAVMFLELLVKKRRFAAYLTLNLVCTAIFFAVIMYHKYYGVIVTWRALAQVGQVFQVRASVVSLTDPYYLLIFTDIVLMAALYYAYEPFRRWLLRPPALPKTAAASALAVCAAVGVFHMVSNAHIYNEIKKAEKMDILNYELYEMFVAMKPAAAADSLVTREEVMSVKGLEPIPVSERRLWGAASGRNVIVVQLESLQNFLIGLEVDGQEVTPVLNGLAREHFYFPRVYQQIGQGNTSDTEFVVHTSLYIPPDGAASQKYGGKQLSSFPKVLKAHGYESMTFHTNDLAFWNRDQLYPALGIDHMYDDDFFGEEDLIAFGASDEVLYRKTVKELEKFHREGRRFYASVISMSAHHPYHLPEKKRRIRLPERFEGTLVGNYLVSQNYADYALGQFIEQLKQKGIWDNSLIIIYGDHFGLPINSMDEIDYELMESMTGKQYDYPMMLNVPLLIVAPGVTHGEVLTQIGGNVDFMPTMANLLGVSLDNVVHFGQDLLNAGGNLLPQRYYLPTGSFLSDEVLFIPGEGVDDATLIPLGDSADVGTPVQWKDEFDRAIRLLELSDQYVAGLPER